jgi:hypothetical protein
VHVGTGSHAAAVSLIATDADKHRSTNWQSPRSSISRLRDRNIPRRRVDRACDLQPRPSRKLDLDDSGVGWPRLVQALRLPSEHRR